MTWLAVRGASSIVGSVVSETQTTSSISAAGETGWSRFEAVKFGVHPVAVFVRGFRDEAAEIGCFGRKLHAQLFLQLAPQSRERGFSRLDLSFRLHEERGPSLSNEERSAVRIEDQRCRDANDGRCVGRGILQMVCLLRPCGMRAKPSVRIAPIPAPSMTVKGPHRSSRADPAMAPMPIAAFRTAV